MNWLPPNDVLHRRANVVLIALFVGFIWLPAADVFCHLDRTPSPYENRRLASYPEFQADLAGAHRFVIGIGTYFDDHFGFRNRLIQWERHWKWQFFHDARVANVIRGKDGWLFFAGGHMLDDLRGTHPFSEADLDSWRRLLEGRRDWLARRGIRYLFVIPPNKDAIYPEYLPDWLQRSASQSRRLDQFVAYLRAHGDLPVLDLRGALREAKSNGMVYPQTDTHWNEFGAMIACQRMVREISALGVPATEADPAGFSEVRTEGAAGDLAMMLGQPQLIEHGRTLLVPRLPLLPLDVKVDRNLLAKKWLPGTEPLLSVRSGGGAKVVMFRDSFATALSKSFGYSFCRVAYVWQQNWDKPFIERERPDIVIDEVLERFLATRDPEELKKKDEDPSAQVFADF